MLLCCKEVVSCQDDMMNTCKKTVKNTNDFTLKEEHVGLEYSGELPQGVRSM